MLKPGLFYNQAIPKGGLYYRSGEEKKNSVCSLSVSCSRSISTSHGQRLRIGIPGASNISLMMGKQESRKVEMQEVGTSKQESKKVGKWGKQEKQESRKSSKSRKYRKSRKRRKSRRSRKSRKSRRSRKSRKRRKSRKSRGKKRKVGGKNKKQEK